MKKHLEDCPVCGSGLEISEYRCGQCSTKICGSFTISTGGPFPEIDQEISEFIKIFIFAEGNIRKVEKLMNCSYPKVKNLLKKARKSLQLPEEEAETEAAGTEIDAAESAYSGILEQLAGGQITTEEALKRIKNRKNMNEEKI